MESFDTGSLEDEEDASPLTDEELEASFAGDPWCPKYESFSDFLNVTGETRKQVDLPPLLPSQFAAFAFQMPRSDGEGYSTFSFEGRRHMYKLYDTPAKRILLCCGRQVEKSTLLGNELITYSCMIPGHKSLYVSPSATQTKTFSNDRVKDPIETSPVLRNYTTRMLSQNVFEKQFVNRAKITLRYAFLNADRVRGVSPWLLAIDEIQDILSDTIPVIEQATSHAPEKFRRFFYAGTPKGLDNPIEYYWSASDKSGRPMSTQNEWAVPCEGCNFWNILGEKNIGRKSLICEKCGKQIYPQHPRAQWTRGNTTGVFEGYRIPQLMVPWRPWEDILLDYSRYSRDKFYNEVLGLSFDSGIRPVSRAQLRANCIPELTMHPDKLEQFRKGLAGREVFAGIDWGCHDEETRILTETGFKYFRDLTDDDKVAQWDPNTRDMTYVEPLVRTVKQWDKPLIHFKSGAGLDLMVTHTHKMRVGNSRGTQWVTESAGDAAARKDSKQFVGSVSWQGTPLESFTLPGVASSSGYAGSSDRSFRMDDWLELLGYLISEGGLCFDKGRPSCLKMSQRQTVNPETYQKIQDCLDRMEIPYKAFPNPNTGDVNWTIYGKQFWSWYAQWVGTKGCEKRISREFMQLDQRQLKILWQALVDGDGTVDPRATSTGGSYSSTSRGLCEDFQELCIKLGLRSVMRLHKEANGNKKTQWRVTWSRGRDHVLGHGRENATEVPYSGKVYCCAVPTGFIVTERNGCISYQGNTDGAAATVLSLGTYVGSKFRIFWIHRFEGEDADPDVQLKKIVQILRAFGVTVIGADYGAGHMQNNTLVREFGRRLQRFQYVARVRKKVHFEPLLKRFVVHRTEVMSDIFSAIKRGNVFEFPRWEEFQNPYAQEIMNIFTQYNEKLRMIQYQHRPDRPDDSFHAITYCFLASMIKHPRPDIITPSRELASIGSLHARANETVDQG